MDLQDIATRHPDITLGLLAGGRGTRLGGIDKAWMQIDGEPLVLRWTRYFADAIPAQLVSANTQLQRHASHGLRAVPDRTITDAGESMVVASHAPATPARGPMAGIDALLAATTTAWLLTLPVDTLQVPLDFVDCMSNLRDADGSVAADASGPQPLFALYRVDAARPLVETALHAGDLAVHRLQARMTMARVDFPQMRFGNINTPADLLASGVVV